VQDIINVDFHVHTVHSPDSVITFDMLVEWCGRRNVDAVAVMDHDVIEGAFEFAALSKERLVRGEWAPRVLVGEEVRTSGGEICGLFLSEHVPKGLTPLETMQMIRSQGGLVYVPHPFDILKLKRLNTRELEELTDMIDIIEAFNGKPRFPGANVLARRFLKSHDFPSGAGSDSHEPTHLGAAHVEMEEFEGPSDLPEKLRDGTVVGRLYSPLASALRRVRIRKHGLTA
jgi:predicted metal-dependent phosphoesterase TrpH